MGEGADYEVAKLHGGGSWCQSLKVALLFACDLCRLIVNKNEKNCVTLVRNLGVGGGG